MRQVIYYPRFEVQNETWLKFALLYLDEVNPIIPLAGNSYLSEKHRYIAGSTDLLRPHPPTSTEGETATIEALYQIERVLQNPGRYRNIFEASNVTKVWQNPKFQVATLFWDKYTQDWEDFCVKHRIGKKSDQGLRLAPSLASLYMTILAQVVGDGRGIPSVTDQRKLDRFGIFAQKADAPQLATATAAQAVINFHVPSNLRDIPLKTIVEHRNRPGFKETRQAFHDEFNKFWDNAESDVHPAEFTGTLGTGWTEFRDDIIKLGTGTATVVFGIWVVINTWNEEYPKAAKELSSGLTLYVGSRIAFSNTWKTTSKKRAARRFLADLQKIKPAPRL